jgi:uncharacterized protein YbcC (UPF0753/DUF2309 family)
MPTVAQASYSETRRMEVRSLVNLASDVIAHYWPMRTFIHHNVLHGLERLDFHEAVQQGRHLFGGRGYLSNELFRDYFRRGRIHQDHVEAALRPLVRDQHVMIGGRRITHLEVLRAHLLHGVAAPAMETLEALIETVPERQLLAALMERLSPAIESQTLETRMQATVHADLAALGRAFTLAGWCDRALGTKLWGQINGELIKWCAAFLDEGQAAWAMPERGLGLYGAWKRLARHDLTGALPGAADWRRTLADLPDRPEDAILDSLAVLGVPQTLWSEYLSLHLAALPGWAGFIKWRAEQAEYAWQQAFPVSLVKYLAIRLVYERELAGRACNQELGIEGTFDAVAAYMHWYPNACFLRRELVAGNLPGWVVRRADRLRDGRPRRGTEAWEALANAYVTAGSEAVSRQALQAAAWRLLGLAKALPIDPETLREASPADLHTLQDWLAGLPEAQHGPLWLEAFERGYQETLMAQLAGNVRQLAANGSVGTKVRPSAQAVFCIDVRSELFRRHLEHVGDYQTFGFAGFFICFIRYRPFGSHHDTDQYPVIMKARNAVREIPRSYQHDLLSQHRARASFLRTLKELVHDLKENVITPYVMVESLGWFYSLPFLGKCLAPAGYRQALSRLRERLVPMVATTLTIDKLSKQEAEEMVAAEQRAIVRRALRERLGWSGTQASPELIEALRRRALEEDSGTDLGLGEPVHLSGLLPEEEAAFIEDLRRLYRIDRRWAAAQKARITQMGFTLDEQVFTVGTALRMMGLTRDFARLVLLCAHGSTSDNNPFEAALDCGACGGNEGQPNARLLAAMANRPSVRERLAKEDLEIPPDTYFLAGQVDTATDQVRLFDLEDVPATHRKDVSRLQQDLREAALLTSQERCIRFPEVSTGLPKPRAASHVRRRSADWSQTRPEWGLSGNAAFIIARRCVTKGLHLEGRVFLHSYDYLEDPSGKLLEILLTAPQVVTQWINMEHYFSTVANDIYGSGSKIYHNVASRVGVMFGTQSDLRVGLARQTVMEGECPYHEPVRQLTIVEAPRERIEMLIQRHELLQRFYRNRWVYLVALEREDGALYRYLPTGEWRRVAGD